MVIRLCISYRFEKNRQFTFLLQKFEYVRGFAEQFHFF